MIGGQTYVNNIEARKHGANNAFQKSKHSNEFSPGAPTPKRPRLRYVMGRSEPGGGKERELSYKREPSLRGGGWGDNLISCVRFREERNEQDKTGLFILNL